MQLDLFPDLFPTPSRVPPVGRYFGGKASSVIREWIGGQLSYGESYVEPFGGLWSVGLWRAKSPIEVYNEINFETQVLMSAIKHNPEPLVEQLNRTDWSRETYYKAGEILQNSELAHDWPWAVMVRCCLGFLGGGVDSRLGIGTSKTRIARFEGRRFDYLLEVSQRLQCVKLTAMDAVKCIEYYDSPDAKFFIDPPYTLERRTDARYAFDYSFQQQVELINTITNAQGQIALSGYDNPLYSEALADWRREELVTRSSGRSPRTEILWMNY